METLFMNTENSESNEPHKFVLNLSQRLDLRSSNKYVALQNLSIYYTWKILHLKIHGKYCTEVQILCLLYQHNKISKKVYNNLIKPL